MIGASLYYPARCNGLLSVAAGIFVSTGTNPRAQFLQPNLPPTASGGRAVFNIKGIVKGPGLMPQKYSNRLETGVRWFRTRDSV